MTASGVLGIYIGDPIGEAYPTLDIGLPVVASKRPKRRRTSRRGTRIGRWRNKYAAESHSIIGHAAQQAAITRLGRVAAGLTPNDAVFAESLIHQWHQHGCLSEKQWHWVERIPSAHAITTRACSIYAIQANDAIKLGVSTNPKRRIRDLQVAHAWPLALRWAVEAPTRTKAKNIEQKLHRYYKSKLISGEWFPSEIAQESYTAASIMAADTASGDRARWPSIPVADPAAPESVSKDLEPERQVTTGNPSALAATLKVERGGYGARASARD